jgi:hypothetical protein
MNATPFVVRLYSKPGCHLCEQAEADLARLRQRYPHSLELIDITADPLLQERFGERIPVIVIADREYAAPIDTSELEHALTAVVRARAGAGAGKDASSAVASDPHAGPTMETDPLAR